MFQNIVIFSIGKTKQNKTKQKVTQGTARKKLSKTNSDKLTVVWGDYLVLQFPPFLVCV